MHGTPKKFPCQSCYKSNGGKDLVSFGWVLHPDGAGEWAATGRSNFDN